MQPGPQAPFWNTKQAAAHYGVRVNTIYAWIRAGQLKAFRFGKLWRILKAQPEQKVTDIDGRTS